MPSLAPDISGFVDAQANLRTQAGTDVTFRVPVTPEWPEGTKINEDTGFPYDATIKPEGAGFTEVTKRCLIMQKIASPLRPQPDTETSALGEMSGMDIILDIAAPDYTDLEDAVEFSVASIDYELVEAKPFEFSNTIYRYLLYGLAK